MPADEPLAAQHRTAFARVYEENVWRVYGFLAYRVRSRDLAEDLTQTTFERALRAWPRFDPRRASEATWLLAIARNLLIDHALAVGELLERGGELGRAGGDLVLRAGNRFEQRLVDLGVGVGAADRAAVRRRPEWA